MYWRDTWGRLYEFEASTASGVFAWFRRLNDGVSVRRRLSDLKPASDADVLTAAREALS
jgi:hypothetical protein